MLTALAPADSWSHDPHRRLALWAMKRNRGPLPDSLRSALDPASGDLMEFAVRNLIGPVVAQALLEQDLAPQRDKARWSAIHQAELHRWSVLRDTLEETATTFAAEGIRLVGLKNVSIARGLYPDGTDGRSLGEFGVVPMGDLDVLIDQRRFREAHALLLESGWALDSTNPLTDPADLESGLAKGGTEYKKQVDDQEVLFELQWRPVSGRWLRQDQEPDGTELVERAVPMPGSAAWMLEPTDNMLQVALHTAKHAYCRAPGLRLHTDVERLALYSPPDWDQLIAGAKRLESCVAIWFSLGLSKMMLDAPVPDSVLEALAPPRQQIDLLARILRRCDIFEPQQIKFDFATTIGFYALLHDTPKRFLATALDDDLTSVGPSAWPRIAKSAAGRVHYMLFKRGRR